MSIIKKIKATYLYKYIAYRIHKYQVERNPLTEINRYYNLIFGHNADLDHPKSLIEKIYWMQLYTDTSMWSLCADKYRMRDYVIEKGMGKYLPKLYGKWDNPDDIDFDTLPSSFVLKANNGCATVKIIKDKAGINFETTKKEMRRWLAFPFGYSGYQPHYLKIKPCIIAEELLIQEEEQNAFSPLSIVDYKVWCFNGVPESIFVGYNRTKETLSMALYDTSWNAIPQYLHSTQKDIYYEGVNISCPPCLNLMLDIASNLSTGFPECRVDFYVIDGKPVIGEMTFSSGYGYFTEEYYEYLGSKIDLSKLNTIHKI